jgi:hypothetical protein
LNPDKADPLGHLAEILDRPVPQTEAEIHALIDAAEEEIVRTYEAVDQLADLIDALLGAVPEPLPKL